MTDIVERLRNTVRTADLPFDQIDAERHEAADEIERLGALAAIVREQGFEIAKWREECEQLRAALQEIKTKCGDPRIVSDIARRALETKP
jgi:hypothetical protein